ncbi:hypothetical protein [Streptomyces sp. TRM68367]|uniref:hypothetical protein n=1 Tax=Streptomyces sp. TRM68367 TaxID=2758415 RepID=UPI00165B661E|nr:hypothetical protein [Streptomyces sp. TRM68367]MBC9731011.1 hypothetical protein [Streptomyces sp. TRM68367]
MTKGWIVHTSRTMHTREFGITSGGEPATLDDVLPELTTEDRVAVVTHSPGGALAAAPLLLAAVGSYYEQLRAERADDFYRYPSYFVLHVGRMRGYHGWLDVWPEHRDVVVRPQGEAVLEALHDRAITRVLLEAAVPAEGELMRENANWFLEDVRSVLIFDPKANHGTVGVRPSAVAAKMIERVVGASEGLLPKATAAAILERAAETRYFEPVTPADALTHVCGYGATPDTIGQSSDYLARHGATARTMAAHRFSVSP